MRTSAEGVRAMLKTITSFFAALLSLISSVLGITAKPVFLNAAEGIYNYCPSAFEEDGTRHLYYCTNTEKYNVTDHIGYRKGTVTVFGKFRYGKESIVLSPGEPGSWDSRHVCDPSVVKGRFSYCGKTYSYLMAYLGCSSDDCTDNRIGLAVSEHPEGPFVKAGSSPFIDFTGEPGKSEWGVGQPSLVSKDREGCVLLFYTKGTAVRTCTIAEEWNLSDLSSPENISGGILSEQGILRSDGNPDCVNNADFALNETENTYYAVSEGHPYPDDSPNFISDFVRISSFRDSDGPDNAKHTEITVIGKSQTGYSRNHNACIVRNEYGMICADSLTVYCSKSDTGSDSLWSYRIFEFDVNLT